MRHPGIRQSVDLTMALFLGLDKHKYTDMVMYSRVIQQGEKDFSPSLRPYFFVSRVTRQVGFDLVCRSVETTTYMRNKINSFLFPLSLLYSSSLFPLFSGVFIPTMTSLPVLSTTPIILPSLSFLFALHPPGSPLHWQQA